MAVSASTARHGVLRALARSARLSNTAGAAVAPASRSLSSCRPSSAMLLHQLRREVTPTSCRASSLVLQQQVQQRRSFAAGGGKEEDDSDDDFKPKRKAVSDDADEISDLIKKQVQEVDLQVAETSFDTGVILDKCLPWPCSSKVGTFSSNSSQTLSSVRIRAVRVRDVKSNYSST